MQRVPGNASRGARAGIGLVVAATLAVGLAACGDDSPKPATPSTATLVQVPGDVPTISEAIERVADGGVVLVSPGIYTETVRVDRPDVTLRGTDRNEVIIDGEGLRANGVEVIADGVRVENLTVRNHTFNGVLVTGLHDKNGPQAHNMDGYGGLDPEKFPPLKRFLVSHVTASNNGLYGIYAFNSHDGVIRDNYASGSADSGFYVGQCSQCGILVTGNVAENNAIGYENANASDSVVVTGNRFTGNRVGATLISSYQEAFLPQQQVTFAGNLVSANTSAESPANAQGSFGVGLGIGGGQGNLVQANRFEGNPVAAVLFTNAEDIGATGNRVTGNVFAGNGVDVADISAARAKSSGTCVDPIEGLVLAPTELGSGCESDAPQDGVAASSLPQVKVPAGVSFLDVVAGPAQPSLSGDLAATPEPLPAEVSMPALDSITPPGPDLFADRALLK